MKYLIIALIVVGVVPIYALESGDYLIENKDETPDILILLSVDTGDVEVFIDGQDTKLKRVWISDDGEQGRIFGDMYGVKFYIIYDLPKNEFKIKYWNFYLDKTFDQLLLSQII